jgi:ABC-type transport system involved in Fe-S cluster assembly fused permease/ATPase subunit
VASNAKINYMGSQNALIRDIAKFNLFEDGVYNANSERKFCTMTNSTTINTGVVVYQNSTPMNPNNPYGQVERSKNGMIQAQGNQIIQDFKVIGTFNQFKQATNGTIQNEITFYLPNGTMIARCTAYGATSHDFTVITTLDNRNAQINTGMITEAQDLARYLVNNGYM